MKDQLINLFKLLTFLWLAGCNVLLVNDGKGSGSDRDEINQQTGTPEFEKPTDDSEGLPGYLINPENLVVNKLLKESGTLHVTAKAGTCVASKPENYFIVVWQSSRKILTESTNEIAKVVTVSVNPDGSFDFSLPSPQGDDVFIFDLSDSETVTSLEIQPAAEGRFYGFFLDPNSSSPVFGVEKGYSIMPAIAVDSPGERVPIFVPWENRTWPTEAARADVAGLMNRDERSCRERCNLADADLSYLDLSGTDLKGAIFTNAILYGANLRGATLEDADFSNADLRKANLQNAELSNTNLSGARLEGSQQ